MRNQLNENLGQNSPEEDLYYSDEDNNQQQQKQSQFPNQQQMKLELLQQQQQPLFAADQSNQYQQQIRQAPQALNNQEAVSYGQSLAVQPASGSMLMDSRAPMTVSYFTPSKSDNCLFR